MAVFARSAATSYGGTSWRNPTVVKPHSPPTRAAQSLKYAYDRQARRASASTS